MYIEPIQNPSNTNPNPITAFKEAAERYPEITIEALQAPEPVKEKYRTFRTKFQSQFTEQQALKVFSDILSGKAIHPAFDPRPKKAAQFLQGRETDLSNNETKLRIANKLKDNEPIIAINLFLEYSLNTNYYEIEPKQFVTKFQEFSEFLPEGDRKKLESIHTEILTKKAELLGRAQTKETAVQIESGALKAELQTIQAYFNLADQKGNTLEKTLFHCKETPSKFFEICLTQILKENL